MVLQARELSFSYGRRPVVADVGFALRAGEWLSVVGPNGAGKTTLLRLLLGLVKPQQGEVLLEGKSIAAQSRRDIARRIALLPQMAEIPFGFTVREVVAMGRTPHLGRFRPMTPADHEAVERALQDTETDELAERPVTELSGGEAQRVFLARSFAQDTAVLVLDEPTTNLDLFHERTLLDQVRRRKEKGIAVVAVLHDLNLAARYSDRVLVLSGGEIAALGTPEETLTAERIQEIFRVEAGVMREPGSERVRIWT
jgi:iron complex transport system ATP-binding protein